MDRRRNPETMGEFWCRMNDGARYRNARKPHRCGDCAKDIEPGERYLDTAEVTRPPYGVHRICAQCTNVERF